MVAQAGMSFLCFFAVLLSLLPVTQFSFNLIVNFFALKLHSSCEFASSKILVQYC